MLDTIGVVQVTSRVAQRHGQRRASLLAARRFGGKSLLDWVVRRVTDAQRLVGVIVVLADDVEQRDIARLVPTDVPVFFSGRRDPLARMVAAVDEFDADAVLCVGVENPFVDPVLIDRLIVAAEADGGCDYASYGSRHKRHVDLCHLGFLAEWCRVTALRRAHRKASHSADRQDVTRYVYAHAEAFRVREVPVPPQLDRDDLRLSIGGEEDWDHAQEVYEALGPECLDWQRIAGLLDSQPALRQRMAVLNAPALVRDRMHMVSERIRETWAPHGVRLPLAC